ncbi:MAG: 4Fe-4S binding protein [Anaerolineae bacterium]
MFGLGMIKGLGVTMRHFVESFVYDRNPIKWFSLKGRYNQEWLEKRQAIDGKGLFTIQYPEQKRQVTENFRMTPMLIYDETPDEPRCTACGICARVCPPQTIWIQRATDDRGRPQARPAVFCIDATICMSCGYCAEFCPFDAIKMNQEHEVAFTDRDAGMFYTMERLLRPVEYYARLHPTDYAREEAERQAKEEAKKKAAEAKEAAEKKKAEAAKAAKAAETPAASTPDDLTRIEGIGPKISKALQDAGIKTFAQLADTDADRIKEILEKADPNLLRLAEPVTWPKQARLAASGKWDALKTYQDKLHGGKES